MPPSAHPAMDPVRAAAAKIQFCTLDVSAAHAAGNGKKHGKGMEEILCQKLLGFIMTPK